MGFEATLLQLHDSIFRRYQKYSPAMSKTAADLNRTGMPEVDLVSPRVTNREPSFASSNVVVCSAIAS